MSRSHESDSKLPEKDPYVLGITALRVLLTEGRTLSGYERNCCFLNTGSARFADVSTVTGLDLIDDGRTVAPVDWDHDGDLDLWITNRTGPAVRFMRNDLKTKNHYLSLRLVGRDCNRDAIGARVEVVLEKSAAEESIADGLGTLAKDSNIPGRGSVAQDGASTAGVLPVSSRDSGRSTLIKTVYAGCGLFTQTSRWLHFGLGKSKRIERVVVRWPGGGREEFARLECDQRYEIVQGSGEAIRWKSPLGQPDRIDVTSPPSADHSHTARIVVLPDEFISSNLEFWEFDGEIKTLGSQRDGHLLIVLWASWCPVCQTELSKLVERKRDLQSAGIDILAISVDDLDKSRPSRWSEVGRFLERINFPFQTGLATRRMLGELEDIDNKILTRWRPLPIPTSFLLDNNNQLIAIYKGDANVDDLIHDITIRDRNDGPILNAAVPFEGRWTRKIVVEDLRMAEHYASVLFDRPLTLFLAVSTVILLLCMVVYLRMRGNLAGN